MPKKVKSIVYSLENLKLHNSNVYTVDFSIKNFQRNFRLFYRFDIISENKFILKSKITGLRIHVIVALNNEFIVTYSFNTYVFSFFAFSQKELVEKFIKHNLI